MTRFTFVRLTVVACLAAATYSFGAPNAHAQSGTRTQTAPATSSTYESRFWEFLQNARYTNWAPALGQNGDFYEGTSPHGAYLKLYLNRIAIGDTKGLPNGSVVVKENYGPDKKTLMAITVMYRANGYNRQGGDWYWVKYLPDGTVAKAPPEKGSVRLAGKVNGCIQCHEGADGGDFLFLND